MSDLNSTITTNNGKVSVTTGDLITVWSSGSNVSVASQVVRLHTQVKRLQAERDEARDAARNFFGAQVSLLQVIAPDLQTAWIEECPWLAEEVTDE
jgi:hypothetical protein